MTSWTSPSGAYRIDLIKLPSTQVYLVKGRGRAYLMDTGSPSDRPFVWGALKRQDLTQVDGILLTHGHLDHVGNVAYLARCFACPVYGGPGLKPLLAGGQSEIPAGRTTLGRIAHAFMAFPLWAPLRSFEPYDNILDPPGKNSLFPFDMLACPGHTKESVVYILEERICFSGDLLISRGRDFGQNLIDDEEAWQASLENLRSRSPMLYLPGHGRPFPM